eukprot:TRINITY_DN4702_c0_g1_i1.p1 TRINITY_DN4702_c0_g1~~TRINITY_DN4702_c0_g1_i1.p1  ORF type:complete len:458 (-),score=93.40 TRINITY_DN4702_c0_g1_i1:78-1451(-)
MTDCVIKRIRLPPLGEVDDQPRERHFNSQPRTSLPSLSSLGLLYPSQQHQQVSSSPHQRRSSFSSGYADHQYLPSRGLSYRSSSFSREPLYHLSLPKKDASSLFSDWSSTSRRPTTSCLSPPQSSQPTSCTGSPPCVSPSPSPSRPLPNSAWSSSTSASFLPNVGPAASLLVASQYSPSCTSSLTSLPSVNTSLTSDVWSSEADRCPTPEMTAVSTRHCLVQSDNYNEKSAQLSPEIFDADDKSTENLWDQSADKDPTSSSSSSIRFHYFDPQVGKEVQMTVINDKFAEKNMFEKVPRELKLTDVTFSVLPVDIPSCGHEAADDTASCKGTKRKHSEISDSGNKSSMTLVRFPALGSHCLSSVAEFKGRDFAPGHVFEDRSSLFMIGGEISKALSKKTFNVYRAMKLRGIGLYKLHQNHVDYLTCIGAVKKGTHSVVLVRMDDGLAFINDWSPRVRR